MNQQPPSFQTYGGSPVLPPSYFQGYSQGYTYPPATNFSYDEQTPIKTSVTPPDDGGSSGRGGRGGGGRPFDESESQSRFPTSRRFRDWPFGILFVVQLIVFFVVVGLELPYEETHLSSDTDSSLSSNPNPPPTGNGTAPPPPDDPHSHNLPAMRRLITGSLFAVLGAVLFSMLWLMLIRIMARVLIYCTMILTVFASFVFAFYFMAVAHAPGLGIFLIIMACIQILWYYVVRYRIEFAADVLQCVGNVMSRFRGMQFAAFVALVPLIVYTILWVATFRTALVRNIETSPDGSLTVGGGFEVAFLVFSLYWTCQVIQNVVHVTCCGVYASWYFLYETSNMPSSPTASSFKRATTTSFGSVCLGSLLVAIIQTIRAFFATLRGSADQDNFALGFISALMDCFLMVIDALIQYFNRYAFVQVATYGKTFCQASRTTWNMFKLHGFEAIVNDDLSGVVLGVGIVFSAIVGGLLAAIFAADGTENMLLVVLAGFILGAVVASAAMQVVDSGVATLFVCFVEHPDRLRRVDYNFYTRFRDHYPECSLFVVGGPVV